MKYTIPVVTCQSLRLQAKLKDVMSKIKDAIILGQYHQTDDSLFKRAGAEKSFNDNLYSDISSYLYKKEVEELQKRGATRKVPVVSKPRTLILHNEDWAYDEMVDNRITLAV